VSGADPVDCEWDAGDLGCGDLVLELRQRLERMSDGQIIRVVASDPGARADMPAWCRMTGHTLVWMDHPIYFIQKRPHEE
jgi:tRNA 2-thiouridine synthesizing protein A